MSIDCFVSKKGTAMRAIFLTSSGNGPTCDGIVMQQGDICHITDLKTGLSHDNNYDQQTQSQQFLGNFLIIFVIVIIILVMMAVAQSKKSRKKDSRRSGVPIYRPPGNRPDDTIYL